MTKLKHFLSHTRGSLLRRCVMALRAWLCRNIVGETLFPEMFPWVAKLRNIHFGRNICVCEAKMFLTQFMKHFLASEMQNLLPRHMFLVWLNWETFASAAMIPQSFRFHFPGTLLSFLVSHLFSCLRRSCVKVDFQSKSVQG